MKSIRWYGPTLVLLITVLLVMVLGPGVARQLAYENTCQRISLVKDSLLQSHSLAEMSDAFKNVAQVVEPSVVHIQIYTRQSSSSRRNFKGMDEEFLRRFFGPRIPHDLNPDDEDQGNDEDPDSSPKGDKDKPGNMDKFNVPRPTSSGSGWVYDNQGHVITNFHVVDKADKIVVRFNDGSERKASVKGADPKTDVAVLIVEGDSLHPATLAAEPVQQGEIVFAFGSPFRFDFSMSQGIVSAKGRQLGILRESQGYENFIQTDAAINPGNSGGPLTNIYGQVVGMNTAIATRTGAYNGLGFAIPVDMVKKIADELIADGKISRGYLGIYIEDLDPKMAKTFGFTGQGVLVINPIEDGPAANADVKRGDIITKINDKPVKSADELRNTIASIPAGTKITLEIYRDSKTQNVEITIGLMPEQLASAPDHEDAAPEDKNLETLRKLGLEKVTAMTRESAKRFNVKFAPGILILQVRPESVAGSEGLHPGAVITEVMGVHIKSVDELVDELARHDLAKPIRLSISENGQERFVALELPSD